MCQHLRHVISVVVNINSGCRPEVFGHEVHFPLGSDIYPNIISYHLKKVVPIVPVTCNGKPRLMPRQTISGNKRVPVVKQYYYFSAFLDSKCLI